MQLADVTVCAGAVQKGAKMISKDDIRAAYLALLGREPENDSVIMDWQSKCKDVSVLVEFIIASEEFKSVSWHRAAKDARRSIAKIAAEAKRDAIRQVFAP
jgi:hypothetical protein